MFMAVVLTLIYTNLTYYMGESMLDPWWGLVAWNWNDFMVMVLVSTGITTSMAVLLTNLLKKSKKRKKHA